MFTRGNTNVIIDLLFNLLLVFVVLFFISFLMVNEPEEQETAKNDNNILITMCWKTDNDIDLWLQLPDERAIWYQNRDEPPAHLDVDVVRWRSYYDQNDSEYVIESNEEIITIRGILEGEYVVNVFYYDCGVYDDEPIEIELIVQDVVNGNIIYAGTKKVSISGDETHFVRFTVESYESYGETKYRIKKVYDDRPVFFIKKRKQADGYDQSEGMGR